MGLHTSSDANGSENRIELLVDRAASRYVVRTLEGVGCGSEIWTRLEPRGRELTGIEVEFRVPGLDRAAARAVGANYTRLYEQLWDEDESMMRRRAAALARREEASKRVPEETSLGSLELLRTRLPLVVEAGGRSWRVVEVDGSLRAHSLVCPHMLGPLDEAEIVDGCLRCPWHGYVFDLATGRCTEGRPLRLPAPPRVRVDGDQAYLAWDSPPA